jgi:hypothetical protein
MPSPESSSNRMTTRSGRLNNSAHRDLNNTTLNRSNNLDDTHELLEQNRINGSNLRKRSLNGSSNQVIKYIKKYNSTNKDWTFFKITSTNDPTTNNSKLNVSKNDKFKYEFVTYAKVVTCQNDYLMVEMMIYYFYLRKITTFICLVFKFTGHMKQILKRLFLLLLVEIE